MTMAALLTMDLQVRPLQRVPSRYPVQAAAALDTARAAEVPVIHIALRLRDGHTDAHPRNKMFGSLPTGYLSAEDPGSAIPDELGPRGREMSVYKNRVSAFSGNNLDQILRAQDITELVLAGVATSGVVLSTALQAADLDYRVTVLSDACADPTPELHDTLMNHLLAQRANVMTIAEWAQRL